jgi:hypothetical protein
VGLSYFCSSIDEQITLIVWSTIANMNRLFLIGGFVVFISATFLITNTPNTTMAYSCSSSSSTHSTLPFEGSSSVSGSSGSCSTSSSAGTGNGQTSATGAFSAVGPKTSGQASPATAAPIGAGPSFVVGTTSSSSSGGAQSSCSNSSVNHGAIPDIIHGGIAPFVNASAASTSQPGHCP